MFTKSRHTANIYQIEYQTTKQIVFLQHIVLAFHLNFDRKNNYMRNSKVP